MFLSPPSPSRIAKKLRSAASSVGEEKLLHLLKRYEGMDLRGEIDATGPDGESTLCMAALHCNDPKVVEELLKAGANPNQIATAGWASDPRLPLDFACRNDDCSLEIMKTLVAHKADINFRNSLGETCLMTTPQNVRKIDLLLEMGADASLVDNRGQSALIHVARNWQTGRSNKNLELLASALQHLIRAGADPWQAFDGQMGLLNVLELRKDLDQDDKLAIARVIVPAAFETRLWKGRKEADVLEAWNKVPQPWRQTASDMVTNLVRELRGDAAATPTPAPQVPVRARGSSAPSGRA